MPGSVIKLRTKEEIQKDKNNPAIEEATKSVNAIDENKKISENVEKTNLKRKNIVQALIDKVVGKEDREEEKQNDNVKQVEADGRDL